MDMRVKQTFLIIKYFMQVFPRVGSRPAYRKRAFSKAGTGVWKEKTLARISSKKHHILGGSIYALYPKTDMTRALRFILSLQAISDYLDNLCGQAGVENECAFRQLHLALLDAVDPKRPVGDYYRFYPYKDDNGYIPALIAECRSQADRLPSYGLVSDTIKKYVFLYTDLQSYKHLPENIREDCLKTWADYYMRLYPGISPWEFSAATGSILGMIALFTSAFDPMLTAQDVKAVDHAYFPWICGLQILLRHYISTQEDLRTGDLNFTHYYKNLKYCEERLCFFARQAYEKCLLLPHPDFHKTVVDGLLAMHLSDPKAAMGMNRIASRNILCQAKPEVRRWFKIYRFLRMTGML